MNPRKWLSPRNNRNSFMNNYNPMDNYLSSFHREMDNWFNDIFRNFSFPSMSSNNVGNFNPKVDIVENEKEYQFMVEVPGISENDIKLDLSSNVLTIRGEKKQENKNEDKNYRHIERYYGSFERSFSLPEDSDLNNIDASFKNGILSIIVPKSPELKASSRKINIKKS